MRTGMNFMRRIAGLVRLSQVIVIGIMCLGLISCAYPPKHRSGIEPYPGWAMASQAQGRTLAPRPPVRKVTHQQKQTPVQRVIHTEKRGPLPVLKATLPKVPNAEYVNEDELCMTCHETHVKLFQEKNVHRQFKCEECHGPASEHVASRGQEIGKILNVKRLKPAERSEFCLRCHEKELKELAMPQHVAQWRTSLHAHKEVSCTDCHRSHHDVPKGTPAVTPPQETSRPRKDKLAQNATARKSDPLVRPAASTSLQPRTKTKPSLRGTSQSLGAASPDVCYRCHQGSQPMNELTGPHKIGTATVPGSSGPAFQCTTCHDARGMVTLQSGKELCLSCHKAPLSDKWHSATHNEANLLCIDCHKPHPSLNEQARERLKQGNIEGLPKPMSVLQAQTCVQCHEQTRLVVAVANPHQVGGEKGFQCTTCHDPHGKLRESTGKELCLSCHSGPLSGSWHSSTHNEAGLLCTDCHKPHPAVSPQASANLKLGVLAGLPRPMAVVQAEVCAKCHEQTKPLVEIAGPHQVGGTNNFQCTTCHDPHGKIRESTRQELCLTCHKGTPTTAWHSSVHNLQGIKCTDCHDPHPNSHIQQNVDIRHTNIRRPQRRPMAVNDPDTCYKCHPQLVAQTQMPSHHPIFEGKMFCSDCHDSHGQALRLLKEPTVNLVCYRCHMEKQGPFVYEHPPATQDCTICHEPHGTVASNLMRQPTTFLCMRCHSGHRTGPQFHDQALLPDIGKNPGSQKAFFTDCTHCHSQVHGSDVPSPSQPYTFAR
jgi:DmsE family decaheme c-type cytochrome